MAPTTQNLIIVINNVDVTNLVPRSSIRVEQRRSSVISTASFDVHKGQNLGLARWQLVLIAEPGYDTVHFLGYLTFLPYRKHGVDVTYQCQCQSIEVRLAKAVVSGEHTGYNTDVLSSLLSSATPDLSNMFDFSPLVDPQIDEFGQTDYLFPTENDTLLDALNDFAEINGATWNVETSQDVDVNFFPNPNLYSNAKYCSGEAGGYVPAGWNTSNVVWASDAGESGGGIAITSQNIDGTHYATCTIGFDGTNYAHFVHEQATAFPGANELYVYLSFRAKISDGTATDACWITEYDTHGVDQGGGGIGGLDGTISDSWSTMGHGRLLSGNDGKLTFCYAMSPSWSRNTTAFTVNIDKIMIEVFPSAGFPTSSKNSYFDGDTGGCEWMGVVRDSASILYNEANQLNWRQDADTADYDIDLGDMTEIISNFEFGWGGFDYINQVIVTGGTVWNDVLWEFAANNQQTVFDLPERVYPDSGDSVISIDINSGTDGTPSWTAQTVGIRDNESIDALGTSYDVLWSPESHWLEFNSAPSLLKRAFRVDGRIKEKVRVTVTDQDEIDSTGLTLVEPAYNTSIASEADAVAVGQGLLEQKSRAYCEFDTYEPGLKPNRTISITDDSTGVSGEELVIESVTWKECLGGGYFIFHVVCGEPQPDLVDYVKAIDKKASDALIPSIADATVTLEPLTFNGATITVDGLNLYTREVT